MDKSLSLLILWLQLDWVSSKQEVMQSPEALNVQEGDSVVLNCSYTGSTFYSLQWFRQDPGKGLTVLLLIQSAQREETSGRIKASLDKLSKHSALYIAASQPSDSATYLCAIRDTVHNRLLAPIPKLCSWGSTHVPYLEAEESFSIEGLSKLTLFPDRSN
uniref:T cell receptor alpha variable 21 n=1 Tax=Panthera tigris altaica TaxID=74533 RepID=A0A8C9M2I9_PANTA